MSIQVAKDEFSKGFASVTRIAENNGGFVISSQTRGQRAGTLTLRIPAKHFDDAMLSLREIGTVQAQSITGKDVTAQFIDLEARLRIAKARRTVLLGLQTQATTIGEVLTVQRQLDNVQLQIEQIQGNLNFINDQVAEATIRVELHEQNAAAASGDDRRGEPQPGKRLGPCGARVPERDLGRGDRARLPDPARDPGVGRVADHAGRASASRSQLNAR